MRPPPQPVITRPAQAGRRRPTLLLPAFLALGACGMEQTVGAAAGPVMVATGAALVLTGRTPVDHVASLVTGRDCSVVRLERREDWCAPPPAPPPPVAYCTRSLGSTDCWTTRPFNAGRQVADPPAP